MFIKISVMYTKIYLSIISCFKYHESYMKNDCVVIKQSYQYELTKKNINKHSTSHRNKTEAHYEIAS